MTYKDLKKLTKNVSLPCAGTNADGESVIVAAGCDPVTGNFFQTTTAQENGWCRINRFYENGSTEEIYEKGERK